MATICEHDEGPPCRALAEAEARIKKLIEHHRLVCNEICGNCDDFECPARGRS